MFFLLANTVGFSATSLDETNGATATGYSLNNIVSGSRDTIYRTDASSSTLYRGYKHTSNMTASYLIVTRADKLITQSGINVSYRTYNGATYDSPISLYSPVSSSDLIGIKNQDLLYKFSEVSKQGFQLGTTSAGTEASVYSDVFFSDPIQLGEVLPGATWQPILSESQRFFAPQRSKLKFEVSDIITLNFEFVEAQTIEELRNSPQILREPVILYDAGFYVWLHRIEHVIIESWQASIVKNNLWTLSIVCRRLMHYE